VFFIRCEPFGLLSKHKSHIEGSKFPANVSRAIGGRHSVYKELSREETRWTVVTPGMRWRIWEIILFSEATFAISMVVNMMWFSGLHSTCEMTVAFQVLLILSLLTITEVLMGEVSL
jgi:hypothetical protein